MDSSCEWFSSSSALGASQLTEQHADVQEHAWDVLQSLLQNGFEATWVVQAFPVV